MKRLVVVALALVMGGCGGDGVDQNIAESGRLVLQKSLAGNPIFTEGSVTHVRMVRDDGAVVLDEQRPVETLDTPLFDDHLRPGEYTIESVELPCNANCDNLGEPAESTRCTVEVDVSAGKTTDVSLVLDRKGDEPGAACEERDDA